MSGNNNLLFFISVLLLQYTASAFHPPVIERQSHARRSLLALTPPATSSLEVSPNQSSVQLFLRRRRRQNQRNGFATPSPCTAANQLGTNKNHHSSSHSLLSSSAVMTLGFLGRHASIVLFSYLFVKTMFQTYFPMLKEKGGGADRCPWPFIFFHDPLQGLRDSPTYMVLCWMMLSFLTRSPRRFV